MALKSRKGQKTILVLEMSIPFPFKVSSRNWFKLSWNPDPSYFSKISNASISFGFLFFDFLVFSLLDFFFPFVFFGSTTMKTRRSHSIGITLTDSKPINIFRKKSTSRFFHGWNSDNRKNDRSNHVVLIEGASPFIVIHFIHDWSWISCFFECFWLVTISPTTINVTLLSLIAREILNGCHFGFRLPL